MCFKAQEEQPWLDFSIHADEFFSMTLPEHKFEPKIYTKVSQIRAHVK